MYSSCSTLRCSTCTSRINKDIQVPRMLVDVMKMPRYQSLAEPLYLPVGLRMVLCQSDQLCSYWSAAKKLDTYRGPLSVRIKFWVPYGTIQCSDTSVATSGAVNFGTGTAFVSLRYWPVMTVTNLFPRVVGDGSKNIHLDKTGPFLASWRPLLHDDINVWCDM